jgi:hypothetical protein
MMAHAIRRFCGLLAITLLISALVWILSSLTDFVATSQSKGADAQIAPAREILRKCNFDFDAGRPLDISLLAYLAIEMHERPAFFRKIEFAIASITYPVGFEFPKTFGIGQINRRNFIIYGTEKQSSDEVKDWIKNLRDDCTNVRILSTALKRGFDECALTSDRCALIAACQLHARDCLTNTQHTKYRKAIRILYGIAKRQFATSDDVSI